MDCRSNGDSSGRFRNTRRFITHVQNSCFRSVPFLAIFSLPLWFAQVPSFLHSLPSISPHINVFNFQISGSNILFH